ncbi:MAG TPA: heme-binding domain-containing protein [Niabella sp.]|nr:heme-binding domain-containing protein [Niabella sp.]
MKKIGLGVLIVLTGIQFIKPASNENGQALPSDISTTISIPSNAQLILQTACYDCHSNNTNYPWYASIQPMGWLLNNHIKDGKKELNFSEFGSYSLRRQLSKLKSIASQVKDDEMPLASYTMLHRKARLTKEQKALITDWAQNTKDNLEQIKP